jgi:hypothetical protein
MCIFPFLFLQNFINRVNDISFLSTKGLKCLQTAIRVDDLLFCIVLYFFTFRRIVVAPLAAVLRPSISKIGALLTIRRIVLLELPLISALDSPG